MDQDDPGLIEGSKTFPQGVLGQGGNTLYAQFGRNMATMGIPKLALKLISF